MKSKLLFVLVWMAICSCAISQDEMQFKAVAPDTVGLDGYFEIAFILENASIRQFTPPDFEGFRVVGGPNQSSNFSVVNGKTSQRVTLTYYVEPVVTGVFEIGPASIRTDKGEILTKPVRIVVVHQYDKPIPKTKQRPGWGLFPDDKAPQAPAQPAAKPRKIYKL